MDPMKYRLLALRSALKLEILGMKRSKGPSVYAIIKEEFGFRGSKQKVLDQFNLYVDKQMGEPIHDAAH